MKVPHQELKRLVEEIFSAAGCQPPEPERIAHYLVESNLVGHDSHGVIRVPSYVEFLRSGKVLANRKLRVVLENDCLAVVDGQFGFGQTIGEAAVKLGVAKAARHGVSVVALRNCGHLGRIGDWPALAAEAGQVSLHFVNTSGAGILVAPHGGIDRRLSANPIAAGVPLSGKPPLVVDISTSSIAEGKIRVALNKGVQVPAGCLIDSKGEPTCDPPTFYGTPPGAILPFGGHKGYTLAVLTELLAGALTGNGCTAQGVTRLSNGMLSIYLVPGFFGEQGEILREIERFVEFVKTSRTAQPDGEILMPGDIEERTRRERLRDGIEIDETTRRQIFQTAQSLDVATQVLG